jgi:hypothetical protein
MKEPIEPILLESAKFEFSQEEGNCVEGDSPEILEISCVSSLGIDREEGKAYFFILKTKGWSIESIDELKKLFDRIEKSIKIPQND